MSNFYAALAIASGASLLSSIDCLVKRLAGAALVCAGLMAATPALADQTVVATDNGSISCDASKDDLTRISLKDDQFASVSKVSSGVASEDFSVVHEPTRGDIYLSVPHEYSKATVSFFGTTQKGFVYKFVCQVSGSEAKQIFVANAEMAKPKEAAQLQRQSGVPLDKRAVSLVQAMFEQKPVAGFEIRDRPRTPVNVGSLKVQLVSEYDGPELSGRVLRIENTSSKPVVISEDLIASSGAIAVSISNPSLEPGQATGAYVVVPGGEM
ncbi:type-F conjugative transfer system secretin TraK [Novosphingobium profundi]|uniref:type-F conjugative transfer system secretin TraK n=1 Tax=Novosphingobium profundi TaxID=1774954 RepID=UPI001BD95F26|nr:type-F conjugative transfer system secretin TraK [Novosphingobium profundi]MBT0671583.1 type-F conjugative transfer system secretin TraK [Novosphingobium profundi]